MRPITYSIGWIFAALATSTVFGQFGGTGGGAGGGAGGFNQGGGFVQGGADTRMQGLQQTGTLTSSAAIQRNTNSFVGSGSGSFLSKSGATGAGGGGQQGILSGLGNFGVGLGLGAGIGSGFGGVSGLGGAGGGGFGRGGVGGGLNQQFQNQNQTGAVSPLRIPMRLGFTPQAAPAPSVVSARFRSRLTRLPGLETAVPGVVVRMDGRTVVLEGEVASQDQRALIANLALLEPGISDVQNDLRIAASSSTDMLPVPGQLLPAAEAAN